MKLRLLLLAAIVTVAPAAEPPALAWYEWSPEVFARAKRENKLVLLDLEAVWCHWCHVMAEVTYRDPAVIRLLQGHYLLVRVDQDSRPDLSNRYEDYGWPATVLYAPDGAEIVKRQGYIPPGPMAALLRAAADDPTPGPSVTAAGTPGPVVAGEAGLSAGRREELRRQWLGGYDDREGGWGDAHKFLEWDTVEYALREAREGDTRAAEMARTTLRLQRRLLDPVWGGVYQYSVGGKWDEPHFEKLLQMQAENLRICALAYAQWGDPADLATAGAIRRYLAGFLTRPDGPFYVSQDADLVPGEHSDAYYALDDAGRRAQGVPRIDRHVYARENGWMIAALAQLAAATGDPAPAAEAERAARWIVAHRGLGSGGFRHDEVDAAGPYLGDTLAMGRAFLALHQLTQQPEWLGRAVAAAGFIRAHFALPEAAGYASSVTDAAAFPSPRPQFDENVNLVRFTAALARVSGGAELRAMAQTGLRWLLAPGVADRRGLYTGGLLLAATEADTEPLHVTIVGGTADPAARALWAAALRVPTAHKLVEFWDPRTGPAPRGENIYPELPSAAAFLCAKGACSLPLASVAALEKRLAKLAAP